MTQTIEFSVVGGDTLGTATLDDDGELSYGSDAVRQIMAGRCARIGDEKAFASFAGWANGYVMSKLVDEEDPTLDEIRALADEDDELDRAAGQDVTAGHDELHHYWTRGEGLAKWSGSPKPWTTLVAHLAKHVGLRKAKIFASRWFIEVKGYAAGSDRNRVEHGHPPRGHRVGPG
jgi:hypothetical protein